MLPSVCTLVRINSANLDFENNQIYMVIFSLKTNKNRTLVGFYIEYFTYTQTKF